MEYFRPTMNQPILRRIPQIAPGDGRRGITKGIAAIGHRFILETKIFMLHVHIVDPEGLTSVVQRARAGTIGIRQWIPLWKEVTIFVDGPERFIPNLVVNDHKLTEVGSCSILNHSLPATLHFRRRSGPKGIQIPGIPWLHHEHAKQSHDRELPVIAVAMKLPTTLLGIGMDIPLHVNHTETGFFGGFNLLFVRIFIWTCCHGIGVGRRRRLSGLAYEHTGAMNMQADILTEFQFVAEREFHAIALIPTNDQGLNPLTLDAVCHPTWIFVAF